MKQTVEERFWGKVYMCPMSGCWLWLGASNTKGYGHMGVGGKRMAAHRISYSLANGDIPPNMDVDHTCCVRSCVNPAHLRACSHRDNILAPHSSCVTAINYRKTSCPTCGGAYTVSKRGGRVCARCAADKDAAEYAANRDARVAQQRAYNAAHREEINAKMRAHREAHREEDRARQRAYAADHREEINANRRARKARSGAK